MSDAPDQKQKGHKPWIGVDLDGTLAHYDEWKGIDHIGDPIPLMLERVHGWLKAGIEVRIVTARVAPSTHSHEAARHIADWIQEHVGTPLKITNEKDLSMVQLWDDRCIQVIPNTGKRADGLP